MVPPAGTKTKQGYELQLGTNNVAPFLFTKLLTPILLKTAKEQSDAGRVRVVWVSSSAAAAFSPTGGVDMENLDYKTDKSAWFKYGVSKAGNVLHAKEFARRYGGEGIISVVCIPGLAPCGLFRRSVMLIRVQSLNPGNLTTDLQRHVPGWQMLIINLMLHPPVFGAYTELFAGLSPAVTPEVNKSGWGKLFILCRVDGFVC